MNPNRENVPAGLVLLADFAERVPERAMDAIERERQTKQLLLLSIQQMKKTFSWNPGRTIWMSILIGLTAFSLLWSMSTITGMFHSTGQTLGGTMKELDQLGISLPSNLSSQVGTLVTVADSAPNFGIGDSIAITIGCMIVYGILKFLIVMPNLDKLHTLNEEEKRLEEEVRYLNGWMSQLVSDSMNQKATPPVDQTSAMR